MYQPSTEDARPASGPALRSVPAKCQDQSRARRLEGGSATRAVARRCDILGGSRMWERLAGAPLRTPGGHHRRSHAIRLQRSSTHLPIQSRQARGDVTVGSGRDVRPFAGAPGAGIPAVVYSLAYGDQPALICDLVDGHAPPDSNCCAAGHKWLRISRSPRRKRCGATTGLTPEQAKIGGLNPKMFNPFLDGRSPRSSATPCATPPPDAGTLGTEVSFPRVDDIPNRCVRSLRRPSAPQGQMWK